MNPFLLPADESASRGETQKCETCDATLIGWLATAAEPILSAWLNSLEFAGRPDVARDRSSAKSECQDSNLPEFLSFSSSFIFSFSDANQAAALSFSVALASSFFSVSPFFPSPLSIARTRSRAVSNWRSLNSDSGGAFSVNTSRARRYSS